MVDTNYEDKDISIHVNLSELCKMDPTIPVLLNRDELYNPSDSSDEYSYHLVYSSDNYMDISSGDDYSSTQETL